jgi:hypothetical protein
MPFRPLCLTASSLVLCCAVVASAIPAYIFPEPAIEWAPKVYVCPRADTPVVIDGRLDDTVWTEAPWTDDFIDIEGDIRPAPRFRTRAKMLWDDTFFYIAAEMEEPDVWATLERRDSVIFYDNDFEVFIDPDGDTHEYYELEVNAFGTEWDLFLTKPYRDDGTAIDSWDIQGLRTGIAVDGTLNEPGDTDVGWSVELAVPWAVLEECAHGPAPPQEGDRWRVNFSRVEWQSRMDDGAYVKITNPETGRPLWEDNWVWSPQGLINMHYPEMWGFVQFSGLAPGTEERPPTPAPGEEEEPPGPAPGGEAEWALRKLYYGQRTHFVRHGAFTDDPSLLGLWTSAARGVLWSPSIATTPSTFEATLEASDGTTLHISQDGHIWRTD